MDLQTAFNIVLTIAAFLGGWVLNSFKDNIKNLETSGNSLADKVQRIEVLVAGQYVKRDDLDKLSSALFAKLDKMEAIMMTKADK